MKRVKATGDTGVNSEDSTINGVANSSCRATGEALPQQRRVDRSGVRKRFIAVVCAQMLLLTGMVSAKAYTLATGKIVTLRSMPIDPYDPFRGEFVNLSYQDVCEVQTRAEFCDGEEVFVLLAPAAITGKQCPSTENQLTPQRTKW